MTTVAEGSPTCSVSACVYISRHGNANPMVAARAHELHPLRFFRHHGLLENAMILMHLIIRGCWKYIA